MLIAAGTRLFLRRQARTRQFYVVQGLTPIRFAGCPMFFDDKSDALAVLKSRGWELAPDSEEELQKI